MHWSVSAFRNVSLLSITAEHDVSVPPEATYRLHDALGAMPGPPTAHRHYELRITSSAAPGISRTLLSGPRRWLKRWPGWSGTAFRLRQKTPGQLFEPVVALLLGFHAQLFHKRLEQRLAPVVAGRPFRELRFIHACRFK